MSNVVIPAGSGSGEFEFNIPDNRMFSVSANGLGSGTVQVQQEVDGGYEVVSQDDEEIIIRDGHNRRGMRGPGDFKLRRVGTEVAVALDGARII